MTLSICYFEDISLSLVLLQKQDVQEVWNLLISGSYFEAWEPGVYLPGDRFENCLFF